MAKIGVLILGFKGLIHHLSLFCQSLRDKQKAVRENQGPNMKQMKMWSVSIVRHTERPKLKVKKNNKFLFVKYCKNNHHRQEVLLNSFHLNGHSLGFHPQTQKLETTCTA